MAEKSVQIYRLQGKWWGGGCSRQSLAMSKLSGLLDWLKVYCDVKLFLPNRWILPTGDTANVF